MVVSYITVLSIKLIIVIISIIIILIIPNSGTLWVFCQIGAVCAGAGSGEVPEQVRRDLRAPQHSRRSPGRRGLRPRRGQKLGQGGREKAALSSWAMRKLPPANRSKHCIDDLSLVQYPRAYALTNKVAYDVPKPFRQKRGCVKWQKLEQGEVA